MPSKLLELTGLGLIAWGLAWAIAVPAGLIFGGAAIVLIGSATDDEAVGMALRQSVVWIRYAWRSQVLRENGIPVPSLRNSPQLASCGCGGDPECPRCEGLGVIPDPTLRVSTASPHPPIKVNPQSEAFWSSKARAREERAKLHDRTPALSRQDYANGASGDDMERLG